MAFVCQRIPNINIASRELYAVVGECQNLSVANFDNGTEFAGIRQLMAETLSVNVFTNSAYNPTSNGLAEVSNIKIKQSSARTVFNDRNFEYNLKLVVSKLNHMPNDNFNGLSLFEIIFNRPRPLLIKHEQQDHEISVNEIGYIEQN